VCCVCLREYDRVARMQDSVLECAAVCCSVLQCVAVCRVYVREYDRVARNRARGCCRVLQGVAGCCRVLQ